LLAGVALPGLVAVYLLHNRKKSRVISSLMLFGVTEAPSFGGRRVEKSRLPWMLLLELLVLALLVLAAAGPSLMATDVYRPLVVVLDNSYSMQAGGGGGATGADTGAGMQSARARALETVRAEILENLGQPTRVIIAGETAVYAGENIVRKEDIAGQLEKWDAGAGRAALQDAVAMAKKSLGPEVRVLVITDHAPPEELERSKTVKWRAFGKGGAQYAITQASVSRSGPEVLKCMVEVANLGTQDGATTLKLVGARGKILKEMSVALAVGKTRQLFFDVPLMGAEKTAEKTAEKAAEKAAEKTLVQTPVAMEPSREAVVAELSEDVLGLDNKVALAAPVDRRVTVGVVIKDEALAGYVMEAVKATGLVRGAVRTGGGLADVLVTDEVLTKESRAKAADFWSTWRLAFERPTGAVRTLTGPYVVKRGHPLLDGVALEGTLWPAEDVAAAGSQPAGTQPSLSLSTQADAERHAHAPGKDESMAHKAEGRVPLIYSGEQPLVWMVETYGGGPGLDVRFHVGEVGRSSLMQSPAWAVFFYNFLAMRGLALPGPDRSIVPLHEQTHIKVVSDAERVNVTLPDGKRRALAVSDRQAVLTCGQVGVYRVETGGETWMVSGGALNRGESDLRESKAGSWGEWVDSRKSRARAVDVSWALGLAGLIVLGFHAWLTRVKQDTGADTGGNGGVSQ
jgi:hypothetical protein